MLQKEERKNIIIIGASGHAKVIIDIIEQWNTYTIIGLIDTYKDINERIFGYKILGTENDIIALSDEHNFSAGIIAIGDNAIRKTIYETIIKQFQKFEFINAIHTSAILGKNVKIGIGNAIMPGVIINSDSKIGDFCILNTNSSLDHDGVMEDFSSLAPNATLGGNVTVCSGASVSLGADIIQNLKIGENAIVGAGAVVIRDVPENHIVAGVPAKTIRIIEKKKEKPPLNTIQKIKVKEMEIVGYELVCFYLKTQADIELYKEYLANFKGYDAFYKTELFNVKNSDVEELKYFILKKGGEVLVLMPFSLRKIIICDKDTAYYDVSSFYGYSGPLFNNKITDNDLHCFWHLSDSWYEKNKVISEFQRFNLSGNYKHYSGVLKPTLQNVIGKILPNEEEQWNAFPPKVRNNYRKAIANNLEAKIFHEDISDTIIETFHEIYISTMERNMAENNYFFSLNYFKNLISSNPDNTMLILICKDDIPISTELVMLNKNTLYSFLGGTISDYFNLRPNDFLKMEVMKWGRLNGYKNYILGGGRNNEDSLYKYKKSFFPNTDDVIYYTGRKIINEKVYEKLATLNLKNNYKINELDITNEYFPLYRK